MVKVTLKVRCGERYQVLTIVDLMAAITLFVLGPICYIAHTAGKGTETSVKESLGN